MQHEMGFRRYHHNSDIGDKGLIRRLAPSLQHGIRELEMGSLRNYYGCPRQGTYTVRLREWNPDYQDDEGYIHLLSHDVRETFIMAPTLDYSEAIKIFNKYEEEGIKS